MLCLILILILISKEYIAMRNPKAEVIPISAKTGEGMKEWTEWLKKHVAEWKQ